MAEKFLMPKLSPTMEEGQISRWVKNEGDAFEANETLAEVDTDKATMEMTALSGGTLLKILKGAGDTAALGEAIAIIGQKGEDISALLAEASPAAPAAKKAEEAPAPKAAVQAPVAAVAPTAPPAVSAPTNGRLLVSPIAARMAAENGLDLKSVAGSGPNGRIIKRDIETALAGASPSARTATPAFTPSTVVGASAYREEPTSQMRRVIASRLAESIGPVPTFYLTREVEMDNVLSLRKAINASQPESEKVSVNDIIVKAVAMALRKHPFVNASYQDRTIRFYEQADIGVAVAIDEGLITPVVRGADLKGFVEIGAEIRSLAARARDKKLQPEEYTGATFSISNLGMFGIKEFTAIINPPEAGIIAVGAATPTPVVRDGQIVIRSIMNITMSCDHRVIDGATGAKFLDTLARMLEQPALMFA
ncbi:MAG: 2-oxoglutarate dehydrogenase, E2 component, dihydrolipoamide succinyltransferase [Acidobacteria bacterium OLB17]|nr:MAG: 2-oxoglutarate dehydrogenase, E2 component, dihydrolipoamide succinyltransferase [Acidobacteria bacterium OLB17]MCZ2391855.1 pyruvate dehydrogenase complex dihydrolipoamide acetyltransferase [Acidobacteriota bacterium]